MRCVILQALLLAACGTMLVHGQQSAMGGGGEPLPYTATTTATSRSEFEGRWQNFHLNASRVQVLSFDASVGAAGATATFVIVGEGHKCAIMPPMSGSHPGSMPPPHPVSGSHPGSMPPPHPMSGSHPGSMPPPHPVSGSHPGSMPPPHPMSGSHPGSMPPPHPVSGSHPGSMPPPHPMSGSHPGSMPPPHPVSGSMAAGSNCVSMGPNDLSQMNTQEIDNVLLHEARVVFQQLGVVALSHGSAWTWRLVNNGTTVVKPKATFEVSVTMTSAALSSEINRNAGTPVVASAACGNSTHSHRSGNAAITCEVEFVSSEAAVKAAASGNANALMSVYSSTTEEGDLSSTTTDGIAHMSVMVSMLCVCAVWALLQL